VHDLVDVKLLDALGASGCPLCRIRSDSSARYLDGLLWEGVNDLAVREDLDAARGYCPAHCRALASADAVAGGGMTGPATLYAAMLRVRLPEIRAAATATGRSAAKVLARAARPTGCPVGRAVDGAVSGAAARLAELVADPAWACRIAAAPFCLDDLLVTWAAATSRAGLRPGWAEVAQAQVARIERLREELLGFAHNSSYDRRHRITAAQRAAPRLAARLLGGEPSGGKGAR